MKLRNPDHYSYKAALWGMWWHLKVQVKCFFLGHDAVYVCRTAYDPGEDDYCSRCMQNWSGELFTIPYMIARIGSRTYAWIVERDWKWFEELDHWLQLHVRLPSWWEY